tara:strand:+ start:11751 stop:11990 length:240 start_codon:yes stop_codon:yes gene_type:complete
VTTKIQPNPSDSRFTAGDLVYIPQDVQLWAWGEGSVFSTPAPTTGIFIEERDAGVLLFIKGRRMMAKKAHIYPYAQEKK